MSRLVGVLLAAGRGARFDPDGTTLKLLAPAARGAHLGQPLAVAAARSVRPAVDALVAVVAPATEASQRELHDHLVREGCTLVVNPRWSEGQSTSLVAGITASEDADGWIVALADMPAIAVETVRTVAQALRGGAATVAPQYRGRRGHPVGFAKVLRSELLGLTGDTGGRAILERVAPQLIEVEDAGVLYDVDTRKDLA